MRRTNSKRRKYKTLSNYCRDWPAEIKHWGSQPIRHLQDYKPHPKVKVRGRDGCFYFDIKWNRRFKGIHRTAERTELSWSWRFPQTVCYNLFRSIWNCCSSSRETFCEKSSFWKSLREIKTEERKNKQKTIQHIELTLSSPGLMLCCLAAALSILSLTQ